MHSSGIGKALLAQMSDKDVAAIIRKHKLPAFTDPCALVSAEALAVLDLEATRKRGYAFDAEEKNDSMRCIAAPVFDMHGETSCGCVDLWPLRAYSRCTDRKPCRVGQGHGGKAHIRAGWSVGLGDVLQGKSGCDAQRMTHITRQFRAC